MADKEQYHLSKPAEWIDKVIAGAVIGTEPMPNLSNQFKAQFRENIGAADATAKWQPLGFFDTVEELEATITNPDPGDAYAIGVEEPFNIWVWDGVRQRWRDGGNMKGMDGKDGEDGSDANVTAENIIAALGYTPADADNLPAPAATTAFNWLDNSDFTQFIAQAGIGGKHGNDTYAGDRWILESGTVTGVANENGNGYSGITLNGTIVQVVANPPANGTPVIEMAEGTASAVYENGEVIITSDGGVIKNAALYEGEYTAENLPKYQPKGYGAEWIECRRYFRFYETRIGLVFYPQSINTGINASEMRITPTCSCKGAALPGGNTVMPTGFNIGNSGADIWLIMSSGFPTTGVGTYIYDLQIIADL